VVHPLDGIYAKLDRAREDLATLHREFQVFFHEHPLHVAFKFNPKTEWHTAYVTSTNPPPFFGVLAGEAVFHMRSALEHLVWALVKANHKKPGKHNTFPIRLTPYGLGFYATTKTSSLRGVRKGAITLIEELQPYAAQDGPPREHFLAVLDDMAKIDRHRVLHGSYVGGDPSAIRPLFVTTDDAKIVGFRPLLQVGRTLLKDGTNIARLRIRPTSTQAKVNMQGNLPALIAFGGREVLPLPRFNEMERSVRKALSLFEPFFER